jgi:hypothetical protein
MTHREVRYVEWVDSTSETGWQLEADRDVLGVSGCQTVGFVLLDNDVALELAQSIDTSHGNIDAVLAIPKVAITKQVTLRKVRG